MLHFDLIIVGGGLVGAGLAKALQQTDIKIALIDASLPSSNDPRLFALNAMSCEFLKNLGLWPALSEHATAIHQVHVSNQGHFGAVRLRREEANLEALGYVIPARFIEAALHASLLALPNITLFRPAKLTALQQDELHARVTIATENGEKILQAPIVIGADGTESTVRKQLGLHADIIDYQQCAIVTRTTLQRSHQQIAYERFTANGAIAMLPLAGNECATIWTTAQESAAELQQLSAEDFLQNLQKTFGYRLGRLQAISQRHVFPLRMLRAEKNSQGCVLLLGNSAHTLHPIAAQGFNIALYEVASLVDSIVEKHARKESLTAKDLQQISAQMQASQAMNISLSHKLTQLFSTDAVLLNKLIPFGMVVLDNVTPIKKQFIEKMMGKKGRVPSLLLPDSLISTN